MAVAIEYSIPDGGVAGVELEYVPLGGDGIVAPHSYYAFEVGLGGDVSGTTAAITVRTDERYTCIPAFLLAHMEDAAAAVDVEMLVAASSVDRAALRLNLDAIDVGGQARAQHCWRPPPMILIGRRREGTMTPPWMRLVADNTNGVTYRLIGRVYNFDVNVHQVTPLSTLLAVLPS